MDAENKKGGRSGKCAYFSKYQEADKHIFQLLGTLYCDKLECENQSRGKLLQYEAEGPLVRKCKIGSILLNPGLDKLLAETVSGVVKSKQQGLQLQSA